MIQSVSTIPIIIKFLKTIFLCDISNIEDITSISATFPTPMD